MSSRNHTELSVLLVDCDHFKAVNDTHGHDFGDACLIHLAKILTESLPRSTDVCARYGGEEFTLILSGSNLEGARIVCERIRNTVETSTIIHGDTSINLTVSIGCVSRRIDRFVCGLPAELITQADKALYKAKHGGRNRSEFCYFDEETQNYICA